MGKLEVTGITVSVSLADKSYGSGSESFLSVQGRYPDPAILQDVLSDGLEMYFSAWKSLLAGRYATGSMTGPEFKKAVEEAKIKLDKIRTFIEREKDHAAHVE